MPSQIQAYIALSIWPWGAGGAGVGSAGLNAGQKFRALIGGASSRLRSRRKGAFKGRCDGLLSPKRAAARDDAGAARPSLFPRARLRSDARVRVGSMNLVD